MAVAAILDFEKLPPFLYYLTDRHQNYWKHYDFDLEHIIDVGNAQFKQFKMAVAANLNLKKTVAISLLIDHHQI